MSQAIDKKVDNCIVITSNTNFEFNFQDDVLNNEFQDLYNSNFDYDIILLKNEFGNNNFNYKRWSVKGSSCEYKEITNGDKSKSIQFDIDQASMNNLFENFKNKSVFERCVKCYDCVQNTYLIKRGSDFFIYKLSEKLSNQKDPQFDVYKKIVNYIEEPRAR